MLDAIEKRLTVSNANCWLWDKQVKLPRVKINGKMVVVRRWLWQEAGLPISDDVRLVSVHPNCVGNLCVNPAHAKLFAKAVKPKQTSCKYGHSLVESNRRGKSRRCAKCSNNSSRHYNHIRRLIETTSSERIDELAVFESDSWTCQLCYQSVDKNLSRRDPMGATLDHVIPISKGGTHTYNNVQLAHFNCNIRKWAHT